MSVAQALEGLTFETIKLRVSENILTLTISRPKALNALSQQVVAEMREVVQILQKGLGNGSSPDWSIRGMIITGEGEKAFVAGGDISEMNGMTPDKTKLYAGKTQELSLWLEELPIPVVAAVNGFALGGGCEMAMACDLIFASANAVFGQPEVALGLIPGFGGTVRLQKLVGPQLALDLIMSGRRIDAKEAHEIGLVARVYASHSELLAGAEQYLASVKAQSPLAVASAKTTVRKVTALSTKDGLAVELDAFAACFATADMKEGTSAFLEKRPANFVGN